MLDGRLKDAIIDLLKAITRRVEIDTIIAKANAGIDTKNGDKK